MANILPSTRNTSVVSSNGKSSVARGSERQWSRRVSMSIGVWGLFELHPVESACGREAFDCVAEGGAVHGGVAGGEVGFECVGVVFAYFAQHPADGFVDEVVWVGEEGVGDSECVGKSVVADEGECGDDCDALFPEVVAVGEWVEDGGRGFGW